MSLDVISLVLGPPGLRRGDGAGDGAWDATVSLDVISLVLGPPGLWRRYGTRDGAWDATVSLDVLGFWLVLLRALLVLHDSSFSDFQN